ncbi:MAG TPA: MoxR family ATPase [Bdellovibrio sp.]|uniref:AAA family ATPase n=1 Tax=Bdellovibrio sp. TaxID=28201 RepID=UPI002F259B10
MQTLIEPQSEKFPLQIINKMISERIVGQQRLIENILICLLSDGHMLIEGMPGLAKTTAAKAVAESLDAKFGRVQFTPDLLPSDLTGSEIYLHERSLFSFRPGPLFNNILLADEINRAPAKVQSALLEAMEEKQVSVGNNLHKLPEIFMVIATQNPIEQEGTYQLPEAQMDRFLMKVYVDYPNSRDEMTILKRAEANHFEKAPLSLKTSSEEILAARRAAQEVYLSDAVREYMVALVAATRMPQKYDADLKRWIEHGASPRATLSLLKASKALAYLRGHDYVTPEHVQIVAPEILGHRIYPSYESEANNISRTDIVKRLIQQVAIP